MGKYVDLGRGGNASTFFLLFYIALLCIYKLPRNIGRICNHKDSDFYSNTWSEMISGSDDMKHKKYMTRIRKESIFIILNTVENKKKEHQTDNDCHQSMCSKLQQRAILLEDASPCKENIMFSRKYREFRELLQQMPRCMQLELQHFLTIHVMFLALRVINLFSLPVHFFSFLCFLSLLPRQISFPNHGFRFGILNPCDVP